MILLLRIIICLLCLFFFFFNDTATTEIYTLSLHDALPIYGNYTSLPLSALYVKLVSHDRVIENHAIYNDTMVQYRFDTGSRSEERFSRNAETDLVCRLLLEKKKKKRGERRQSTVNTDRADR